jgi:polyhydroxyalkanoate synthase
MFQKTEELLEQLKAGFGHEDLTRYLGEFSQHFNEIISQGVLNQFRTGQFDYGGIDFSQLTDPELLWKKLMQTATIDPSFLFEKQLDYFRKQSQLWQQTTLSLLGVPNEPADDVTKPARDDGRFRDAEWSRNPVFNHLKQSYLLNAQLLQDLTDSADFKDEKTAQQARFIIRQFANSLSPTNFLATNPEACRAILETKGQSLYKGLQHFLADLKKSPQHALTISMADAAAFRLGENIAMTPGEVVYRNHLMELIQYRPQTETVFRTPLLITPAFINKFYIFDLAKKTSFVDWLAKSGFTVFIISWINPTEEHGHLQLDDYMQDGVLKAREIITGITGETDVNAIGYCVGGTLLACTQAWLAANDLPQFQSTTFFTTLLDFSDPGELSIYISDEFISGIEQNPMNRKIVDGRSIMLAFSLMRENNLYWSFFVNNYLLGKDPAPFDLLYWNSDATNLPLGMFSFYLRNMYLHNRLVEPGSIRLDDTPLDLGRITAPAYFLSTIADHIAPWECTYLGQKHLGGERRFVLAGSGHIAGVMNPAGSSKYGFWTNPDLPESSGDWLRTATRHEGSWWGDWFDWAAAQSGEQVLARQPGSATYTPLEPAPGQYVRMRVAAD